MLPRGNYLCWRHEYGPSGVGFQKLSPQRGSHIAMVTPTIILTNDCASHILLQRWKHFTGTACAAHMATQTSILRKETRT